jgi:hypothetical protein
VISKTTVLFVREVRALGIFGPSVAPRHRAKKCLIFSRANIFHVRIFFATSMRHDEHASSHRHHTSNQNERTANLYQDVCLWMAEIALLL